MLAPPATPEGASRTALEHAGERTAEQLWDAVSRRLRETLNETTHATWFAAAGGAHLSDEAFVVVVPNDFTREWIESHFLGLVRAATRDELGREVRVAFTVTEEPEPAEAAAAPSIHRLPRRARQPSDGRNDKSEDRSVSRVREHILRRLVGNRLHRIFE